MEERPCVCIGLGGIFEGYIPSLLLFRETRCLSFSLLLLVDGKVFRPENRSRQHFHELRFKAQERCRLWSALYPHAPLRYCNAYVTPTNISDIITDGSVVLLSPDNHATRKLVSDHAETLQNILLISGGNDGIDHSRGEDGVEGAVIVHCRIEGRNLTPPITKYHPEIRQPHDLLPSDLGCVELAQRGQPQVLTTNLLVGAMMVQMLDRYLSSPPEASRKIVEVAVNVREGCVVPYGIAERCPES